MMYLEYFGLSLAPFSIAPDPRFLYLSEHHKEALAHLLFGVSGQGGFVVLTGEVGTGKTTICRCFLEQLPENTDVAFIVNPRLSARELLATICDELNISYAATATLKGYTDLISNYLLQTHAQGRHTAIIIDEAQNLRVDVLEQLRLLTNLETADKKLLQIVLLGQPELKDMLARQDLRQLSQRVTARYHLVPLNRDEVEACVRFRLAVAGQRRPIFTSAAFRHLYRYSKGIPRLINLLCDRALLGAWSEEASEVTPRHIRQARKEIMGELASPSQPVASWLSAALLGVLVSGVLLTGFWMIKHTPSQSTITTATSTTATSTTATSTTTTSNLAVSTIPHETSSTEEKAPAAAGVADGLPDSLALEQDADARLVLSQELSRWLSRNENALTSGIKPALQSLLIRWPDVPASSMEDCGDLPLAGLSCLERQGNWQSIRQINRPAILKLYNSQGQAMYVALLGLEGEQAHIAQGDDQLRLPTGLLDQFWYGDYTVVWRVPPFRSAMIQAGDIRDPDKWLADQMNKVVDQLAPELTPASLQILKQVSLREKVRWFQKYRGLIADGIAGEQTYIQINSVLRASQVPFLTGSAEPAS
ncbi:MAG: AAA family ATPase [Hahellaceae bacterium]|nr:AAA family ATPase [Hahellaceae bacterium]